MNEFTLFFSLQEPSSSPTDTSAIFFFDSCQAIATETECLGRRDGREEWFDTVRKKLELFI